MIDFFNNEFPKPGTDSHDYYVIVDGVFRVRNVPGMTCEIGVREGGGSAFIMKTLAVTDQHDKVHIGIDPFGNIEYRETEDSTVRLDYDNSMRNRMMLSMSKLAYDLRLNYLFFPLEDTEFFARYADGVPVYDYEKRLINNYALVHFDGPHDVKSIREEVMFFWRRASPRAVFIFDDTLTYNHTEIHQLLTSLKFKLNLYTGLKASYVYCPNDESVDED